MSESTIPTLDNVYRVLGTNGRHPVLLYVKERSKAPVFRDWPKLTYELTLQPAYQRNLRRYSNTGVLLGPDDLCTVDCDTEEFLNQFQTNNPAFKNTLISQGETGAQFWFYATGSRPKQVHKLFCRQDSPLARGCDPKKIDPKSGLVQIGEFRAEGGQSIIRGIHPCGEPYKWPCQGPPISFPFDSIIWQNDILIPWTEERRAHERSSTAETDLLKRAISEVSIDYLWTYFGYPPREGRNPVCSPFRKDNDPSFSIYDCGCRFKDHARDNVRGDSFDFYQLATRQNASEAFVDFIELAGLGAELKRPSNGTKCRSSAAAASAEADETAPKSVRSAADIAKKLGIYYDPERACYWSVDSWENWIKINETSVARHLAARGYRSTKRTGETVSVVDRIINKIQCSMNVEYAGSLAGYQKGLREYSGKRLLIVDSPCLIEPRQGDWSTVRDFLNTLLDAEATDPSPST